VDMVCCAWAVRKRKKNSIGAKVFKCMVFILNIKV
jgi:hypothetical protein